MKRHVFCRAEVLLNPQYVRAAMDDLLLSALLEFGVSPVQAEQAVESSRTTGFDFGQQIDRAIRALDTGVFGRIKRSSIDLLISRRMGWIHSRRDAELIEQLPQWARGAHSYSPHTNLPTTVQEGGGTFTIFTDLPEPIARLLLEISGYRVGHTGVPIVTAEDEHFAYSQGESAGVTSKYEFLCSWTADRLKLVRGTTIHLVEIDFRRLGDASDDLSGMGYEVVPILMAEDQGNHNYLAQRIFAEAPIPAFELDPVS